MFAVDCAECGFRYLLSVHSVVALHTLASGVLLVELTCHRGHVVTVLTGRNVEAAEVGSGARTSSPAEPVEPAEVGSTTVPDRVPRLWSWAYAGRAAGRFDRLRDRFLRFVERQAALSRSYVEDLHR